MKINAEHKTTKTPERPWATYNTTTKKLPSKTKEWEKMETPTLMGLPVYKMSIPPITTNIPFLLGWTGIDGILPPPSWTKSVLVVGLCKEGGI